MRVLFYVFYVTFVVVASGLTVLIGSRVVVILQHGLEEIRHYYAGPHQMEAADFRRIARKRIRQYRKNRS